MTSLPPATAPVSTPPVTPPVAAPDIEVHAPTGRQRVYFERALDTFGLREAARDGRFSEAELKAVGLNAAWVRYVAEPHGSSTRIDDYLELVRLGGGYTLPYEHLLDPMQSGDYVIFAPKHLQPSLRTLCAHRANDGRKPVMIDPEDVYLLYGKRGPDVLARYLKHTATVWSEPHPRFVMMVGSPNGMPARESSMDQTYLSDARFGAGLLVGRLPFDNAEPLENYVRGLIDQEARVQPGTWQLSATIVDGDPMWGGTAARWIDRFTSWQLDHGAPADRIVRRLSQNPAADTSVRSFRPELRDAMLVSYIGHGGSDVYDTFTNPTLGAVKPLIVSAACSDAAGAAWSSAGQLIASGGGLAAIAAPVDTHPVPNLIFSEALAKQTMSGRETVGELLEATRADVRARRGGFLSQLVLIAYFFTRVGNAITRLLYRLVGKRLKQSVTFPSSKTLAKEHAELYTIFGDPAARLRQPIALRRLQLPVKLIGGKTARIGVEIPPALRNGARATVVLETRDAHDAKVVANIVLPIVNGKLAPFTFPREVEPGMYRLRVIVQNDVELGAAVASDVLVSV